MVGLLHCYNVIEYYFNRSLTGSLFSRFFDNYANYWGTLML